MSVWTCRKVGGNFGSLPHAPLTVPLEGLQGHPCPDVFLPPALPKFTTLPVGSLWRGEGDGGTAGEGWAGGEGGGWGVGLAPPNTKLKMKEVGPPRTQVHFITVLKLPQLQGDFVFVFCFVFMTSPVSDIIGYTHRVLGERWRDMTRLSEELLMF